MKKILSFFLALALCLTVLPSSYLDVYAAEEDPQPSEEIYEVYNGFGELEFTASSIEEVEEQLNENYNTTPNDRSAAGSFLKLCKFLAKYVGPASQVMAVIEVVYTTVSYANGNAELIDVIDTIVSVSVLKKLINSNKRGYLYGKNAGPNPYPPHSYQGSMWVKSQTYYVIGG